MLAGRLREGIYIEWFVAGLWLPIQTWILWKSIYPLWWMLPQILIRVNNSLRSLWGEWLRLVQGICVIITITNLIKRMELRDGHTRVSFTEIILLRYYLILWDLFTFELMTVSWVVIIIIWRLWLCWCVKIMVSVVIWEKREEMIDLLKNITVHKYMWIV